MGKRSKRSFCAKEHLNCNGCTEDKVPSQKEVDECPHCNENTTTGRDWRCAACKKSKCPHHNEYVEAKKNKKSKKEVRPRKKKKKTVKRKKGKRRKILPPSKLAR